MVHGFREEVEGHSGGEERVEHGRGRVEQGDYAQEGVGSAE